MQIVINTEFSLQDLDVLFLKGVEVQGWFLGA